MECDAGPAPSSRTRWVLFVAMAISVVAALSSRDLWSPDEPWYGRIAWEMERGGDWVVPHFNGSFDAEKPPLVYWAMAATGKVLGGVTPVAARLPCALLAALAVFATARLGRRWFGDAAAGDTAALLFATSGIVLWNSSRAGMDLPMTAFALLATWAGTSLVARPSVGAALGFGASLGLGILVKGPHALYVPVTAMVGGCVAAGVGRRLRDLRWLLGLLAMAAVVAAWLIPALVWGEKGYGERLLGQLTSRIRGENEPHVHAFPYLIGQVLVLGLPWTPAWLVGARIAVFGKKAPAQYRFGLGAALGGALLPLLLLSIPASKREVYLIPLLPCLSILAAHALHRSPDGRLARGVAWTGVGVLLLVAVGALGAPLAAPSLWPGGVGDEVTGATLSRGAMPFVLVGLGAAALVAAVAAFRRRTRPLSMLHFSAAALGAVWAAAAIAVLPVFDDAKTWAAAVAPIRRAAPGAPVVTCGFTDTSLAWALRPDVVARVAKEPAEVPTTLDSLFAPGAPPTVVAVEIGAWKDALSKVPSLRERTNVLWTRRVGPRVFMVLVPAAAPR